MLGTPPAVSRPGKLTPAAEARLLVAFGLQDTLTREEALVLAEQVSASSTCSVLTNTVPFYCQHKPNANWKAHYLHGQCLVVSHLHVPELGLCYGIHL